MKGLSAGAFVRLRKLGSVALYVIAGFAFLNAAMSGCAYGMVTHSLEKSHKIDASFQQSARFAEAFWQREGRLPTQSEFDSWSAAFPNRPTSPNGMEIIAGGFGSLEALYRDEALGTLGAPPEDSYYLFYWRGEWGEYYAGWSGQSTLPKQRADYYAFGSALADGAVFLLFAGGLRWGAKRLRPRAPDEPRLEATRSSASPPQTDARGGAGG